DWIGHTEYSETRIEQLDHIFNLIGIREEGLEGKLDYLPKPLKTSPYFNAWTRSRADADTPALMAAYDAELLHMKRDGRLKALYDKYGIPYIEP
ncbi:hypothetical protein ACV1DC_20225, partial [Aeromonas caviae]